MAIKGSEPAAVFGYVVRFGSGPADYAERRISGPDAAVQFFGHAVEAWPWAVLYENTRAGLVVAISWRCVA